MKATEFTRLRSPIKVLSYEVLKQTNDVESNSSCRVEALIDRTADGMTQKSQKSSTYRGLIYVSATVFVILFLATLTTYASNKPTIAPYPKEGAAWSAIAQPLSFVDPETLGFIAIDRPEVSMPGPIFGELLLANVPLPTNSWCENLFLGSTNTASMNRVFQLPYVIDTESQNDTQGVNTHPAHVQANDRTVEVLMLKLNCLSDLCRMGGSILIVTTNL
jgi:hypothetical protein